MRCKVVSRLDETLDKLNKEHQSNISVSPENGDYHYNCWGFAAAVKGLVPDLYWMGNDEMETLLDCYTIHVDKPQVGDIAVWREYDSKYLTHTAIITELDVNESDYEIIHKPGGCDLETANLYDFDTDFQCYNELTEYRHVTQQLELKLI